MSAEYTQKVIEYLDCGAAHSCISINELMPGKALLSRTIMRRMIRYASKIVAVREMLIANDVNRLYRDFSEPNWDDEGASAVSEDSVQVAKRYIRNAARVGMPPDVTIDRKGRVCFQWGDVTSKYLLVKFTDDGGLTAFMRVQRGERLRINKCPNSLEGQSLLCLLSHQL